MQEISSVVSVCASNDETVPDPGIPGAAQLMNGQLVAIYKKTHDEQYIMLREENRIDEVAIYNKTQAERYRDLYIRRLMYIGFTIQQAMNLHMYELMTLKHDSIDILCDPGYLRKNYFNLKNVMFPESAEYYAEHQTFLVSELTKIWDEAEYDYKMVKKELPADVQDEICRISRYGGGDLFIKGLTKVSESTNTPMALIQAYARAEQGLLYKYKWYPDSGEKHPYGEA